MGPYFITYFVCLSLVLFDFARVQSVRFIGTIFSFPFLLILIGLRDETGSDWLFYRQYYQEVAGGAQNTSFGFEFGFEKIIWFVSSLGISFSGFIFLYTFLCLVLAYSLSWKLTRPNTFVFLFFSLFAIEMIGTLRQFLAILILAPLGVMVARGAFHSPRSYYWRLIIASQFHTSAIVLLPLKGIQYFTDIRTIKKINLILLALILAIFLNIYAIEIIRFFFFSEYLTVKLSAYVLSDMNTPIFYVEDTFVKARMFIYRLVMISLIYMIYLSDKKNKLVFLFLTLDIIGFLLFTGLYFVFPPIAVRLGVYFSFFEIMAFSSIRRLNFLALFTLVSVIALSYLNFINTLSGADADLLVPYKGIWYNSDLPRTLR